MDPVYMLKYCCSTKTTLGPRPGPGPGVSVVLDGLNLAADLLRGEAVEPALTNDHQDAEERRQSQHGCLKLPEEMFLHHCRATALVLVSVGSGAVDSLHVSRRSAGRPRPSLEGVALQTLGGHNKLLEQPAGGDHLLHCCSFLLPQQGGTKHPEGHQAPEQSVEDQDSGPAAGYRDPTVALHQPALPPGRRHPDRLLLVTDQLPTGLDLLTQLVSVYMLI